MDGRPADYPAPRERLCYSLARGPGWSAPMKNDPTIEIVLVLLLGAAAQWLAWRARLPSILVLLVVGFVAGPMAGWIHPDKLLGDALLPLVSLSVAVILFEGGLNLRLDEMRKVGRVVRNLLTIGVAATWLLASAAAYFVGLDAPLAVILGALLTVTGPTVIFPMLRHIRPRGQVASILRWEGIANDPIGALLAVLVFEFVLAADSVSPALFIAAGVVKTIVVGSGMGVVAGFVLALALHRYWIPDYLANPLALATAIVVFVLSNHIQAESGLFAATIAGVTLAHRSPLEARHILEFKENIRVLLISLLFILLSARFTTLDLLGLLDLRTVFFVAVLILVVRPLSILASTLGTETSWSERCFLAWMAPRGIVAAAVSSVFALQLEAAGHGQAKMLMLLTFATIIGTVFVYGITAAGLGRRLGLAERDPQGVLIIGAQKWACRIARTLTEFGFKVILMDTNRANVSAARLLGFPTHIGSALAQNVADNLDLGGMGRLLALTPNDEVNALACQQFSRIFGRANVYQLPPKSDKERKPAHERHLHGRWLFSRSVSYASLEDRAENGWTIKTTRLTPEFDYAAFRGIHGDRAIPLFVITQQGRLIVLTAEAPVEPVPGQTLVSLVPPLSQESTQPSEFAAAV